MELQEIQERNKQIALMLGADVQDILERIYIDKMIDAELIFHNVSVSLNSYEWNGTTNIHYIPFDMLQFHSDWNWIMEAVEFIDKTDFTGDLLEKKRSFICTQINSDIGYVFKLASDFAKLYNEKKI
jgi:hypothetical protein